MGSLCYSVNWGLIWVQPNRKLPNKGFYHFQDFGPAIGPVKLQQVRITQVDRLILDANSDQRSLCYRRAVIALAFYRRGHHRTWSQ